MFHGAIVATVTPFRNGKLDRSALKKLVKFQIDSGTDGIVPCGTTGESATLSFEEHERVIDTVLQAVDGRVPVIAGTGSNNTKEAVALTRFAKRAGASAALVITPYYNKPTQDGLCRHFRAVAESANIPIILYNVPGRTGVNMTAQTVAQLAEIPNIVGVKEASGNLSQVCDIIRMTPRKFCVLSGEDSLFFPMMALGARGVISVTSNVAPRLMAELYDTYVIGEISRARDIHYRLWPLFQALFLETNPIPAKTALAMMRMIREEFRLPLSPMGDANRKALARVLSDMRLA
ncbi:MAG: 4-hydroxy-tetrahydrodipicolinate synthase [Deltaproteobacteria bacterium]|jgi:4-hydroxy-tetrahydrodipicolinate synthase|nr:4-hydroxy-tetrahydrodipicolinate synthase [Deltaproteobacteria bacterium]